jgi:hypothetical protein
MSRKKTIVFIILIVAAGVAWYGYKEFSRTNKDLGKVRPDITVTMSAIISEYETSDSAANGKYLGKVVEVSGTVKEVNKDDGGYYTVVLGDAGNLSAVRCSMDTTHQEDAAQLAAGSSAIVRGACTGFNKDEMGLGSDVILNRCVIVKQKK